MIAFLEQIISFFSFLVTHIVQMLLFIPKMLGMFSESTALISSSITFAPPFLYPILALILAVAFVMWLVNLL